MTARAGRSGGATSKVSPPRRSISTPLVEASALFTPADIEFAARKAAQFAFERAAFGDAEGSAGVDDFLRAISEVRPTLFRGIVREFEEDIEDFARF